MVQFVHPSTEDISLSGVLAALADPLRVRMVKTLLNQQGSMSCTGAAPCTGMAKSTLSNHFRILREAGLVRTCKKGVENLNTVRADEVNARFPGLLDLVLRLTD